MARYALIKNGAVQNVIIADPDLVHTFEFDADEVRLLPNDSPVGVDHDYDGKQFIKNPEPEPEPPKKTLEEQLAEMQADIESLKAGQK